MNDLIQILLKGLAGYLPILASVVGTPKRSILKLVTDEPDKLNKALVFCGISIAIGFIFQAPLLTVDQDITTIAGSMLALKIFAIITFAGIILLGFRLVGGKGDYETTLCAGLYITSPIYLFIIFTRVIYIGIISAHDPKMAAIVRSGQSLTTEQIQSFTSLAPMLANSLIVLGLLQFLISVIWFLICWEIYRIINQVSKARSMLVYIITTIMWYVYWALTVFMMKGLYNGMISPIL
ncbi:MAG: hypothetical protein GY777_05865 [Candidatus Brocadiaceae bacterium]|nr:hypothetical protein [Candidatus Brocadiaceae bacterium]